MNIVYSVHAIILFVCDMVVVCILNSRNLLSYCFLIEVR